MLYNKPKPQHIAIFSPQLGPVGTAKVMFNLADGFTQHGYRVDLLRSGIEWRDSRSPSGDIRPFDLTPGWLLPMLPRYGLMFRISIALLMALALPQLVMFLRRERPGVLIAGLVPAIALLAVMLARVETRVIVSVQGWPKVTPARDMLWRSLYSRAASVVAPSEGVAREVSRIAGIGHKRIAIIPNPVLDDSVASKSKESLEDASPTNGQQPVILGVGRLTAQKHFGTLIRAFDMVRREMDARLLILGEGEERHALESLTRQLGMERYVDMPGYVNNPYKYMARASVFVLSSRWEGPGHVLIEALSLGTPVVSTDCPSGPREILLDGKAGLLTPVGDSEALARAILNVLHNPEDAVQRTAACLPSISRFYTKNVVESYLSLIDGSQAAGPLMSTTG
jgi:glycosyltransferase involved in cell wall biosynthesis